MPTREDKKRHDDDLLVTHKPATAPSPDKLAHNRAPAPAMQREELELMRKQVLRTTDAAARRELIARMQQRFGNDKTNEVVRELRHEHLEHADDNLPGRSAPAAAKKGKA